MVRRALQFPVDAFLLALFALALLLGLVGLGCDCGSARPGGGGRGKGGGCEDDPCSMGQDQHNNAEAR